MVSFTVTWPKTAAATSPATATSGQPRRKASATSAGTSTAESGRKTRRSVMRSISRPTVNWVAAPHSVAAVAAMPASHSSDGLSASRSCMSFGIRTVKVLNTRPETAAISSSTTIARRTSARGSAGTRLRAPRADGVRGRAQPGEAERAEQHRWHQEARAPAEPHRQEGGDHRGERDADVAKDAVQPERRPGRSPAPPPAARCRPGGRWRRTSRPRPAPAPAPGGLAGR